MKSFARRPLLLLGLFPLILALLLPSLPQPEDRNIYQNIIRLHVLASSDSETDQQIKLAVRDRVLDVTSSLLASAKESDEAVQILLAALDLLKQTADQALSEAGSKDESRITLCRESYPTRSYGSLSLPAGTYTSLKIEIGPAQGQNWWCVLFPSLCLSSATTSDRDAFLSAGFTPDQYRLLTQSDKGGYLIRFRLLEFARALFGG